MDPLDRVPIATSNDLIEAHVKALLEKLSGPYSEKEVEAEIEAINDLIEARVEALLERLTGLHGEEEVEAAMKAINDLKDVTQGRLQIKCAWCGLDIGFKPGLGVTRYCVTHGICPDCFEKIGFEQ